jgi:hypothetical protein
LSGKLKKRAQERDVYIENNGIMNV